MQMWGAKERPVGTRNDCKKHLLDCLVTPSNIKDDKGRYLQEFFSAIAFCPSGIVEITKEI